MGSVLSTFSNPAAVSAQVELVEAKFPTPSEILKRVDELYKISPGYVLIGAGLSLSKEEWTVQRCQVLTQGEQWYVKLEMNKFGSLSLKSVAFVDFHNEREFNGAAIRWYHDPKQAARPVDTVVLDLQGNCLDANAYVERVFLSDEEKEYEFAYGCRDYAAKVASVLVNKNQYDLMVKYSSNQGEGRKLSDIWAVEKSA